MIIVTGGAGFIGSNLVKGLNELGHSDILVVDNLTDGTKFRNLVDCQISDYLDKHEFLARLKAREFKNAVEAVFHQGACSATTVWDGAYMLANNYEYSKVLLHYCLDQQIPLIYASSAAVYGNSTTFIEVPANEVPLNVYGYSKLLFDQYVRRLLPKVTSQVVGLRYFNVYGPREQHKGKMASVVWHARNQLLERGTIKLFGAFEGYAPGEQLRDFVSVADIVKINLWFWQRRGPSGVYNAGTGKAASFNALAQAVVAWHQRGQIEYVPFPAELRGSYQSFTQADLTALRAAGYPEAFQDLATGVANYLTKIDGG